ncbi:MAG: hydroxymethylbilane synthase [Helicobacter sp.]|nr:hydroxymethylbilane synthase [Helicobacter sp.]
MRLQLGTRASALALWQAEYIRSLLLAMDRNLEIEIVKVQTKGDAILNKPLSKIGGKGLFTQEIENAMHAGELDFAVHSLKDVPVDEDGEFVLAAFSEREDRRDCFVSEHFASLESLPKGALVGTTSLRRTMQLKHLRPDLRTQSLRGNVITRLERLRSGHFDAIILASAGVQRLGLQGKVAHIVPIPIETLIPAVGQGIVVAQCKRNNHALCALLGRISDSKATLEALCERSFSRSLGGGCQAPVGICAVLNHGICRVEAIVGLLDGSTILKESLESPVSSDDDAQRLGIALADLMRCKGAKALLAQAREMDFEGL